jgi:hypothetical protein
MPKEPQEELGLDGLPGHDYFLDAVNHIDEAVASEQYFKAARAIEMGESEDLRYRYIKSAKDSIKDAFPEVFEVRHQAPKYLIKEDPDHRVIKTIAIAALILVVLYSFVKFGPTGDLSKTWTADDIPKATAYPK